MRILDREAFLTLPAGTVYSKYKPCVFDPLEIKGDSLKNDYYTQQLVDAIEAEDSGDFVDRLESARRTGSELTLDLNCQGRDGFFDVDQLFAVWSNKDVEQLIDRLREAQNEAGGKGK